MALVLAIFCALCLSACRQASPNPAPAAIEWVRISSGTFMMGADDAGPDAQPVHAVAVGSFEMAKTLVTNKQYQACVKADACTTADNHGPNFNGDDQPVIGVDWDQAKAYSHWAGGRLPSEAEWEYAARSAGKARKYPWGDAAATCDRAVINAGSFGCGRNATWPVCSKPKGNTEQGLCDMAGDIWEWVEDRYHGSYVGAPADGGAWEGAGSSRVVRGGSWDGVASVARAAYRHVYAPSFRYFRCGFRPARST